MSSEEVDKNGYYTTPEVYQMVLNKHYTSLPGAVDNKLFPAPITKKGKNYYPKDLVDMIVSNLDIKEAIILSYKTRYETDMEYMRNQLEKERESVRKFRNFESELQKCMVQLSNKKTELEYANRQISQLQDKNVSDHKRYSEILNNVQYEVEQLRIRNRQIEDALEQKQASKETNVNTDNDEVIKKLHQRIDSLSSVVATIPGIHFTNEAVTWDELNRSAMTSNLCLFKLHEFLRANKIDTSFYSPASVSDWFDKFPEYGRVQLNGFTPDLVECFIKLRAYIFSHSKPK